MATSLRPEGRIGVPLFRSQLKSRPPQNLYFFPKFQHVSVRPTSNVGTAVEGTLNEVVNPPGSPTLHRRPRDTKPFSELLRASVGYTGTQGAGQHDDSGEVDAAPQKPHARRAVALF